MAVAGRLKAASGDYSRVCKQTVPAALAFSLPSAFPPSEPSRERFPAIGTKSGIALRVKRMPERIAIYK